MTTTTETRRASRKEENTSPLSLCLRSHQLQHRMAAEAVERRVAAVELLGDSEEQSRVHNPAGDQLGRKGGRTQEREREIRSEHAARSGEEGREKRQEKEMDRWREREHAFRFSRVTRDCTAERGTREAEAGAIA